MELIISALSTPDEIELSQLLLTARTEYVRYFNPFPFDAETIGRILKAAKLDRYWGIRAGRKLVGFFMLRGLDDGYERPSFGVFVAENFSKNKLGSLALQYSLSWCKLNNISKIILKVHPENTYARRVYENAGFVLIKALTDSGQYLFEKQLS